ncbi:hypothetical protein [Rhizobium oryziradicis]|uniref:Uncharacterized protein n=1 Tax=Rhizobium oryziradicis TaxID=1867956 RepID=A0A1Q8ZUQ8_9HYPH|nr:hypothetical protein [Rhizobium oryziradicis]OLP45717.1 hypothetical protein BJF95_11345 [Rhizobium oryziradicis]
MKIINKSSAFASAARPFYEEHAIGDDLKMRLEDEAKLLIGAQRRSTEEAFESGERLDRVALLLPEGTVEKWAVECCGYTSRHIRTMRAVARNLNAYKQILVDLAVGPTVLGKLSAATPEQVEQAIGFAGMHGRLRVQDVTAIIAGSKSDVDENPDRDPYDLGGLDGLKAIIAIKVRDGLKSFVAHIEEILTHVADALPKNNIVKKTLAQQIALTARLAHRELESLAEFVTPNPRAAYVIDATRLPAGSRWAAVSGLLYKMGSDTSWPDKAELRTWLKTEVVPTLEWVTSKKPLPTFPNAKTSNLAVPTAEALVVETPEGPAPEAAGAPSIEDAVTSMAAAFGIVATVDLSMPEKKGEESIPTLTEALAKTDKRVQRPAFLAKAKPTSPPSATA